MREQQYVGVRCGGERGYRPTGPWRQPVSSASRAPGQQMLAAFAQPVQRLAPALPGEVAALGKDPQCLPGGQRRGQRLDAALRLPAAGPDEAERQVVACDVNG